MKLFFILILGIAAFTFAGPVETIKEKDKELQTLIKKKTNTNKEKERIKALLNASFNFKELAVKSIPSKIWKTLEPTLQESFTKEFERMVRNSSAKRLEVYRADSTIYEEPKMSGKDKAKVTAHTWYKGKETILEYKMIQTDGKWAAWDLVIDDLSTARNYKEQFSKILETKTFQELIDIIKNKADEAE